MSLVTKPELINLQKALKTDEEIGKKLGVTRQAIHQLRKKYGIDSRYTENPDRNKKIIALHKSGMPATEIAIKMGLSPQRVFTLISENKAKKKPKK